MSWVWKLIWPSVFVLQVFGRSAFYRLVLFRRAFLPSVSKTQLRPALNVYDLRAFVLYDSRISACYLRGADQNPKLRHEG